MKYIFLILLGIGYPFSAFPWGAVYMVNGYTNRIMSISLAASHDDAMKMVEDKCRTAREFGSCGILGKPVNNKIAVVFFGDTGYGFGADIDAKKAINIARLNCESRTKNCHPKYIDHFGSSYYASVAYEDDLGYFVSTNHKTQELAEKAAMALCIKQSNGMQCRIVPKMNTSDRVAFAEAVSASENTRSIQSAGTVQLAQDRVMSACEVASNEKCKLTFQPVWNDGASEISEKNQIVRSNFSRKIQLQDQVEDSVRPSLPINDSVKDFRQDSRRVIKKPEPDCRWIWYPHDLINRHMVPGPSCF